MSDAFDEEEFMDSIEGDLEFLEEAVATFDEDTPALIARIGQAVEAGDANALIKPAHTMKGLVGNFCAVTAETSARELETMGRAGQLAGANAAFDRLRRQVETLRVELHELLQAKTG